jgi:hypothetical protein
MKQSILLLGLALGAEASPHMMKAAKRNRSLKDDKARVSKHLHALLKKAPEQHKESLQKEIDRFSSDSVSEIDSWYGYPMTLDWIVDIYFDEDDATAYKVILDSGSSNLAIALESCTNCGEASTTLDLTTNDDMCIEVTYGSGEWSGVEVESTYVGLSSDISTTTTLAGITYQDDFFSGGSSYCGILGMAYSGIAESYSESACSSSSSSKSKHTSNKDSSTEEDATPYMYALRDAGTVTSNTFAVAMCGDDADVSIGGIESSMYTGDVDYATTQKTFGEYYGYYLIYTSGVSVGTTSVDVENINLYGGLVVDTGTTLHYLPTATTEAIEKEVKSTVGSTIATTSFFEWESCVSSDDLEDFPTITYTFAESDEADATTFEVSLLPKHYLLKYDSCYYWGFESSSLGIFGNIGMEDKMVVFDIENTRIGFAEGSCTSTESRYKSPGQLLGEVMADVNSRSSSDLAVGLVAALAVVGTVLGSAFVVINKLVKKSAAPHAEENQSLLPPL